MRGTLQSSKQAEKSHHWLGFPLSVTSYHLRSPQQTVSWSRSVTLRTVPPQVSESPGHLGAKMQWLPTCGTLHGSFTVSLWSPKLLQKTQVSPWRVAGQTLVAYVKCDKYPLITQEIFTAGSGWSLGRIGAEAWERLLIRTHLWQPNIWRWLLWLQAYGGIAGLWL